MANEKTTTIFCANCQEEEDHKLEIAPNGEVAATCKKCQRVLKFATSDPKEFKQMVESHKEANEGQVSVASQEKLIEELSK